MSATRPRRIAVIATASGNGKTTLGRRLASGLDLPFAELDALVHGPGWTETSDDELRAIVAELIAADGWVLDGAYERKLGTLVLDAAELIVWLDLPVRVWLTRLVARTARRVARHQTLWNGNRETLRGAVGGRDSVIGFALRTAPGRRRRWRRMRAGRPVVRLRSAAEVSAFAAALLDPSGVY